MLPDAQAIIFRAYREKDWGIWLVPGLRN